MPRADVLPAPRWRALLALALVLCGSVAFAAEPKQSLTSLDDKEFFKPDLYISSSNVPLADVQDGLANKARWLQFQGGAYAGWVDPTGVQVWIDPRSGTATNIMGAFPLIPGKGVGNSIKARGATDAAAVERAVRGFIGKHADLLGIDVAQLGEARVSLINDDLWQVYIPQVYQGLPVRHGHLVASISHGNLVTIGVDTWGNVGGLDAKSALPAEAALQAGFAFAEGPALDDVLIQPAKLEVVPFAPSQFQSGSLYAGAVGQGYGHRLVYSMVFQRPPEDAQWEVLVDASNGEVIALQDINHYVQRQVTGGVYPVTSTQVCSVPNKCGVMQTGWPMPFANLNLAAPNNFANSAGVFDGPLNQSVTTTLVGRYVRISDTCGAISVSGTGTVSLGGTNGQHDCTSPTGGGNTAASRSAFYEVNKLEEMARGWLPNNTWLSGTSVLLTNVNIQNTCNAFWNGTSINFYRSGGGCRNTGELAGVFDHEWGHGLDDNDVNGSISNSGEGYADIAAIYRYQDSCVGHGFFDASSSGSCGLTADGTGRNTDEDQTAGVHCATDCSGVRDSDFGKHSDGVADTPANHVCPRCNTGTGPCGRQVHCAAAPQRQAAWDVVARDLPAAGFDSQTAFMIGNRLFYQGSGNIGTWYSCTCGGTSSGCGATNGYTQWITADDDNGNLNDGTPHIAAIRAAFNRHGIGCATPTAGNSGCSGQPNGGAGPTLSVTPGSFSASLSWGSVTGATRYWVLRTEGHAGCNYGKALIATVTGTSFTDTQVANDRPYSYNVVAVGPSASCFSRVSNCVTVTPGGAATPDFTVNCPASASVTQGASTPVSCSVTASGGFASAVTLSCPAPTPNGVSCAFSPNPVTPTANSTLTISATAGATTGNFTLNVQGVGGSPSLTRTDSIALTVTPAGGGGTVFFDDFETNQGWTTNAGGTDTATTGQWARANPETTTSGVTLQNGTTFSGVNDLVTGPLAGASAGTNDVDAGVTTITSPAITLPSTGTLTLSFQYYLAHLNNATSADFLRVFVVGTTTSQVFQELGDAASDAGTFASFSTNISAFAGQTIRLRIEAADAATASLIEAAVDDVRITQQ